jgi:hypothetical protein
LWYLIEKNHDHASYDSCLRIIFPSNIRYFRFVIKCNRVHCASRDYTRVVILLDLSSRAERRRVTDFKFILDGLLKGSIDWNTLSEDFTRSSYTVRCYYRIFPYPRMCHWYSKPLRKILKHLHNVFTINVY